MSVTQIRGVDILDRTISVGELKDLAPSEGVGLSLNYENGSLRDDNTVVVVASGSVALTDNSTNFVEVDSAGVVTANTVGFNSGRVPLAEVSTSGGFITALIDKRAWLSTASGGGGGGISESDIVEGEIPSGTLNGVNTVFTLANTPNPQTSLKLYLNGLRQQVGAGNDYTLSGATITFSVAPVATDVILADYRK